MTHYVWPPYGTASELGEAAAACAWWFGAIRDSLGPAVVLSRTRPDLSLVRAPLPSGLDDRIGLRLAKMNMRLESAASPEAFIRLVVDSAEKPASHIVSLRGRIPQSAADAFGEKRAFLCDERLYADASLAFLRAADALAEAEPANEAWAGLRRATRDVTRIVVAGPDIAPADAAEITRECRFVAPELFVRLDHIDDEIPIVVGLDDPVRHLGPSRSAASLRDVVIERVERHRNAFLCVPRPALALMRSRVSGTVHNRLLSAECAAQMDPGPATLIAAAASVCDTVDVIGYAGEYRPLPDDQLAQHPAYAAAPQDPADISDVLADADVAGARVSALGRTHHPGLRDRDRGRVPTRLDLDGVRLDKAVRAHRFPADGTSRAELSANLGGRGSVITLSRIYETGEVDTAREIVRYGEGEMAREEGLALWPEDPGTQVELLLDELDRDSDLVLTRPPARTETARQPGMSLDQLRQLVRDVDGPDGPFDSEADEMEAIRTVHRLVTRDLDRIHVPRMTSLSWRLQDRVFAFGPGADWPAFNAARLAGELVLVVDTPHAVLPPAIRDGAALLMHLSTTPVARLANAGVNTADDVVMITALAAAHRADANDIIVDARAYAAPDEDGTLSPSAVAVGVLQGMRARPIVLVSADAGPFGIDVTMLGDPGDALSRAAAFHKFVRPADWHGAPRLLLVLAEGTSLDQIEPIFSGLGDRLLTLIPREGRIIATEGDHFLKGSGLPRPAFVPGDPAIAEAIQQHQPAVMLCEGRVPPPISVHVPLIALGEGTWTARANLDVAPLPRVDAAPVSPAALDRARLALIAAVAAAQTMKTAPQPELAEPDPPQDEPPRAPRRAPARSGASAVPLATTAVLSDSGRAARDLAARIASPQPVVVTPGNDSPRLETESTIMAETTTRRHNPFRAFWPWPGTALFLLVSLWLFYMAWMASAPDLQKAFAGLGALMFLLSLFGLRSRRRAPPAAAEQVAPLPATHRRSNIADDVGAAGTPPPAEPVAGRMPRNARMRREAEAPQPVTSTTTAHSVEADEQKDATPETDPVAEVADDADAEPVGAAVTAETMSPLPPMTLERLVAQVQSLESQINREKAERGAQFAQLDTRIGAAGTADAAASEDASASANTLDAGALDERLSQFLTINAFNDVMNKKVLQRISALIDNKIAEATKPETLRERIGDLVAPAATTAPADGGGDQEALRSELAALRESLSAAVAEVRDTADSAAKLANRAVSESGEGPLRRNVKALREETAKLNEAVEEAKKAAAGAAGTAVTEAQAAVREALAGVETRVDERLSQATDGFDALRGNVSAVLEHISRMDGEFKKVLSLVEAIGHAPPAGKGEAGASPSVGAEVEALRDALTTIIAQNREIREKQDVLTARFDPPVRVRAERFED